MVTVRDRRVIGYVLRIRSIPITDPLVPKLVDILDAPPEMEPLSEHERDLAEWMAARWLAPVAEAVRIIKGPYARLRADSDVTLTDRALLDAHTSQSAALSETERHILEDLRAHGGSSRSSSIQRRVDARDLTAALQRLENSGLVRIGPRDTVRETKPRVVEAVVGYSEPDAAQSLTEAQRRVLAVVRGFAPTEDNPLPVSELMRAASCSASPIRTLAANAMLEVRPARVFRQPQPRQTPTRAPELTRRQDDAVRAVLDEMANSSQDRKPVLLHGVTGSGKTEVYLAVIEAAQRAGRGAILVVPEIALTTQIVDVVSARFGAEVAVLHSALGSGERYDEWDRVASGRATVAIGARSAVFAPVRNLGVIILDEEHDHAFKQENTPRYHARDVAMQRARTCDALVVMGSATPAIETYHAALTGRYRLVELPTRIADRPLPTVHVLDMREEFRAAPAMFAAPLRDAIAARLAAGEQTILFLNRRGFAQFILCRDCGHVIRCKQCSVSLTYHAGRSLLVCHHCGDSIRPPTLCPQCRGSRLRGFGLGTERVQQEVQHLFPSARVARMDRDTTQQKGSHRAILQRIRSGDADILIGTQMVAKGLDFPRLTLVGVVSADTGLNIPDFRAAERTFQILTQVAGRAGRSDTAGEVFIQAFSPDHYAVQSAAMQDYRGFYEKEIEQRRELRYPPFSCLANVVATHAEEHAAISAAQEVSVALRDLSVPGLEVLGPSPAPIMRLKGRYRWHVVVRGEDHDQVAEACRLAVRAIRSGSRSLLTIDVDPVSLS